MPRSSQIAPPLQPLLLQIIIASSKNAFLNRDWRRLPSASPDTIFLLRGPSAWNSAAHMVRMVRVLGVVCRTARPDAAFVLVVDMCSVHLADEVFQAMHGEGLWPLLIPAKGMWLLQPLGLAVFRLFKQALRRLLHMELQTARARMLMRNGFSTSSMGFRLRGARP